MASSPGSRRVRPHHRAMHSALQEERRRIVSDALRVHHRTHGAALHALAVRLLLGADGGRPLLALRAPGQGPEAQLLSDGAPPSGSTAIPGVAGAEAAAVSVAGHEGALVASDASDGTAERQIVALLGPGWEAEVAAWAPSPKEETKAVRASGDGLKRTAPAEAAVSPQPAAGGEPAARQPRLLLTAADESLEGEMAKLAHGTRLDDESCESVRPAYINYFVRARARG